MAYNTFTQMLYVLNSGGLIKGGISVPGTISAINGFTSKVAAGVIFNVNPANSGKIICNESVIPTNSYIYIDSGTNCTAEPNKDYIFNTWTQSPLTNLNSSTTVEASPSHPENVTLDQYGFFTANFKPAPPPIPPEYWTHHHGYYYHQNRMVHTEYCWLLKTDDSSKI